MKCSKPGDILLDSCEVLHGIVWKPLFLLIHTCMNMFMSRHLH